ncbi:hypothetical protein A6J60_005725 [Psychrobacter sp. FDAARGOS_221]|nr:hypothetical protein A6J60_005725 [Psychrobacter sp. FDAARGOS_221]
MMNPYYSIKNISVDRKIILYINSIQLLTCISTYPKQKRNLQQHDAIEGYNQRYKTVNILG